MHNVVTSGPRTAAMGLLLALVCGTPPTAAALEALGPLDGDGRVSYFIEPPPADTSARPADRELAIWALESWQRAAEGKLTFVETHDEAAALVRVYWAPAAGGQYGEMRSIEVGGLRGAAVFVRPDVTALGDAIATRAALDSLFRDTIVYLTCLHELGHALGLEHTAEFADIMYFFGFGGDITEYFGRFRRQLNDRGDIRTTTGLSANDLARIRALY